MCMCVHGRWQASNSNLSTGAAGLYAEALTSPDHDGEATAGDYGVPLTTPTGYARQQMPLLLKKTEVGLWLRCQNNVD